MYTLLEKLLKPTEREKKERGEVNTPYELANKMILLLQKYGDEVFKNPFLKWFEPANGNGIFIFVIFKLLDGQGGLMRYRNENGTKIVKNKEGKKFDLGNTEDRRQWILEEMIYISEIDVLNCMTYENIFNPEGKYKMNIHCGNTLELDIKEKWGIDKFDIIVGNPPYNKPGNGGSRKLWDKFVIYSLKNLKQNGFLCFIHPPIWRKPENKIFKIIKNETLLYLNMISETDTKLYFNCSTKVDYYLLKKTKNISNIKTDIITNNNRTYKINLEKYDFIPNTFEYFSKIYAKKDEEQLEIICPNTSYSSDMKWMKEDNTLLYKYILTINSKEIKYRYSSLQKNYNGIPKVILSLGRYPYPYNDYEGNYGLSCYTFGIKIQNKEEGDKLIKLINSKDFQDFLKNNKWSSYNIEWRMFKYLKKNIEN